MMIGQSDKKNKWNGTEWNKPDKPDISVSIPQTNF